MPGRIAPRLTYGNVVATVALFLALGGGAYAAVRLPANSVGTRALKNGAVTSQKLADGAVTARKVAAGSLTGRQIDAFTLGTVLSATHATSAGRANTADGATHADDASHAATADNATHAGTADDATHATAACNGVFAFGQIRGDGSIKDASTELSSVAHTAGTGLYCLLFKDPPPFIALEGSVVSPAGTDAPVVIPRVTTGQGSDCSPNQLAVRVYDTAGTPTDGRFSFIVP